MPLIQGKSKKAFGQNVSKEMNAGKPQPQALAIAYAVKKKNQRKKMSQGGLLSAADEKRAMPEQASSPSNPMDEDFASEGEASIGPSRSAKENEEDITANNEKRANAYAQGGMAASGASNDANDHYDSIADAILAKRRKAKMMADGGEVDLEENSEESLNNEDDMSFEAGLKEQYDDSQLSSQPMGSNEHGHELSDEDSHDMVSSIRKKMKAKGRI